jgi:hypothetical protein
VPADEVAALTQRMDVGLDGPDLLERGAAQPEQLVAHP